MKRMKDSKIFMVFVTLLFVLVMASLANAASLELSHAEKANWQRTSTSAETVEYVQYLAANSGGRIRYDVMGYTVYGRPLPLAIVGVPSAPKSPAEVGDRIVIHIQCNIHSGEVEGKEASHILLREIAEGKHDALLKDVVLLYNSNFNPDGNDTFGTWRLNSQPSPEMVGTRTNAQGFNLNRDMVKLDSPEARAHVRLWRKWNPVVVIDEHATDGVRTRHPINYNFGLNPNTSAEFRDFIRLIAEKIFGVGVALDYNVADNFFQNYMRKVLEDDPLIGTVGTRTNRPPLTESVRALPYMESYGGVAITTVGGVTERRPAALASGGSDSVRTSTSMPTVKNRIALLFECHSHNEFRYRVHTQYAATISAIQHLSRLKKHIMDTIKDYDDKAINLINTGVASEEIYPTYGSAVKDDYDLGFGPGLITIEGFAYALSGDQRIGTAIDPNEDRTWTNLECRTEWPATSKVPMGAFYIMDPAAQSSVQVLLMHGVKVYRLSEDVTLPAATTQKFYNPSGTYGNWTVTRGTAYEGRNAVSISAGDWNSVSASGHVATKGHYVISSAQPFGKFASFLLEPKTSDGLCYWGFWDAQLFSTENNASGSFDIVKTFDYSAIPSTALEELVLMEDADPMRPLQENEILGLFSAGKLPTDSKLIKETMKDGTIRYLLDLGSFVDKGVLLDGGSIAEGWMIVGFDPTSGENWQANLVNNKLEVTFTGDADDVELAIYLLNTKLSPEFPNQFTTLSQEEDSRFVTTSFSNEVRTIWVTFSGSKSKSGGGGGCVAGYELLVLLAVVPLLFVFRKKK